MQENKTPPMNHNWNLPNNVDVLKEHLQIATEEIGNLIILKSKHRKRIRNLGFLVTNLRNIIYSQKATIATLYKEIANLKNTNKTVKPAEGVNEFHTFTNEKDKVHE